MASPETLNGISLASTQDATQGAFVINNSVRPLPVADQVAQNRTSTTTIKQYSFIDNPKYHLYITAEDYSRQSAIQLATGNITDQIILPIPNQMIDNHKVEYSQEALGPIGATAVNGVGAGMAARNPSNLMNTMQGFNSLYEGLGTAASATGGFAASLAYDRAARGLNPMVVNSARAIAGIAQNQFMVILLKGPSYKKFTFEWHLSPKNKQQTDNIANMIKMLNNAMAPGYGILGSFFFTFPKIFRIQFRPNDQYMYKFKPAVLESMSVNYTGAGMPAFYNSGGPESVKIQMHFMEMEFWTQGQF